MKTFAATISALFMLTACSGGEKPRETELHAYATSAPQLAPRDTATADSVVQTPPMTSLGVGPVRLGMDVPAIPRVLPGVYDSLTVTHDVIATDEVVAGLLFTMKGDTIMTGEAEGSRRSQMRVTGLSVVGRGPGINIDDRRIAVGTRLASLQRVTGLRQLPSDDSAYTYFDWRGITVCVTADSVAALYIR